MVVRDSLLDPSFCRQVSEVGRQSGLHSQSCQQSVLTKPLRQTSLTDDSSTEEGTTEFAVVSTLSESLVSVDVEPLVLVIKAVGLLEVKAVSDAVQEIPDLAVLLICNINSQLGRSVPDCRHSRLSPLYPRW